MKISSILRTAIAVLKKPMSLIPLLVVIVSMLLAAFAYRSFIQTRAYVPTPLTAPIPTLPPLPTTLSSQTDTSIVLPLQDPTQIQGIDVSASTSADKDYPGIYWFRVSYPTCGWGDLKGQKLKDTLQRYHREG